MNPYIKNTMVDQETISVDEFKPVGDGESEEKCLTSGSIIMCPHSGRAIVAQPNNTKIKREGHYVLIEKDFHIISGCPYMIDSVPSPCIKIQWIPGPTDKTINGAKVLIARTSVGICSNADQKPQGPAQIVVL